MFNQWITSGKQTPFYARKEFPIEKPVLRAQALVCGLGQFVFHVNGQKVGDHELDPGWTNYRKLIQYVSFDVTELLRPGQNALGAEVGNGWFIRCDQHYTFRFPAFMPPNPNDYQPFGESLVLGLELVISYADGTEDRITADESFRVADHPIVMSNVYGSETFDSRAVQEGWSEAGFDDSSWQTAQLARSPAGKLMEQFQPAIHVIKTYPAKKLGHVKGRDIYDLGQNISGILEVEFRGEPGQEIRLYPAEKLDAEGNVDQMAKGWAMVDSCVTLICNGNWQRYRMKFTYFAGRYLGAELPEGGELRNLRGHAITSAWKRDGSFTCDDDRYMKIYDLVEKAVEANMLSVHTDCPTIERFAWQEPNHLMAPSIFFMKDGKSLWEKFLLDLRTDQHNAEDFFLDYEGKPFYPGAGLAPSQAPCYVPNPIPGPMGSFYDIIPWGSTLILGPYWHYLFYGDIQIIEDNFEPGLRYLAHLKTKMTDDGFISHGLGDWGNPRQEYARENLETAFLYADAVTLARFAALLGREADRRELAAFAEEVRANYNEKLLVRHPEKGFACYRCWDHPEEIYLTQAAQALPLYWGMVPEKAETDVAAALKDTLERGGSFVCGEVGLPYVIQCARRYGMNDLIARFITKPQHPSYYAFVLDGETTLGEYWEQNPRSHCHDMMGHIIEWYYNGIAGIQPAEPGFKSIVIQPYLPEGMNEFSCCYQSVQGEIKVSARRDQRELFLTVAVPDHVGYEMDISLLEKQGFTVHVSEHSFSPSTDYT